MESKEYKLFFGKNMAMAYKYKPNKKDVVLGEMISQMNRDNFIYLGKFFTLPISKKVGTSIQYIKQIIKEFEEKELITKTKRTRGEYIVNPYIFGSGNLENIQRLRWEFDTIFDKNDTKEIIEVKIIKEHE